MPTPNAHPSAAAVFPALGAAGLTSAQITLNACSMVAPHYHPNAEEIIFVLSGGCASSCCSAAGCCDMF